VRHPTLSCAKPWTCLDAVVSLDSIIEIIDSTFELEIASVLEFMCRKPSSPLYKPHPRAWLEAPNPNRHCRISLHHRPTELRLPVPSYCLEEDHWSAPLPPEPSLEPELHRKTAFTIANHRPNRITTAGLLCTISATKGEQNGDPLSPRLHRW
jgi:uncharacterized Zn-finger protein